MALTAPHDAAVVRAAREHDTDRQQHVQGDAGDIDPEVAQRGHGDDADDADDIEHQQRHRAFGPGVLTLGSRTTGAQHGGVDALQA